MSTTLARPDAVIFDMDGLMIDTEKIYHAAWQAAARSMGYTIHEALFSSLVGIRTEDCEKAIRTHLGADFPLQDFQSRWEAQWDVIARRDGIECKPGLLELLDRVDALGIPKAVGTSSTLAEAERSLTLSDLRGRFSVVVTGDQVPAGKPAPDIFLEAAARLAVNPAACIVFEDSSAGALAASRAGMTVFVVPDLVSPSAAARQAARAVLTSLHDALPLFATP